MSIRTAVIEVSLQRLSLLRIEHPQANPLTIACTLRAGESLPSGITVKAEVHASRNVAAETTPLASSTVSVSADATSFEVSFSSAQLNQVVAPNSVRPLWLVVYGVGPSDTLYTLAAAEVALGWHAISQITPPPPSVALLADIGGSPWASGVTYQTNHIVGAGGSIYLAVSGHVASAATQPGTGADWQTVWALYQGGPTGGGNTILSGAGAPSNAVGSNGDFWINTTSWLVYGPKAAGAWPAGVSMIGPQGPQGPQGLTGATGPQGPQGPQGLTGATGPTGPQGPQGLTGATGATGPQGPQGLKGDTGSTGATGPQGPAGPQGPTGSTGPAGATGATGPAGAAATIAVGTVTTLAAGSSASVTNVGTSAAAIFDFGIPQGAAGSGGGSTINVQTFEANGTWNNPSQSVPRPVFVRIVAGGGGGASGRCDATGDRFGGGAGVGGGILEYNLMSSRLGATEPVTVGAGGTGAGGVSAGSSGNNGGPGGNSSFAGLTALGGAGGIGGTTTGGAGGAGAASVNVILFQLFASVSGGSSSVSGAPAAPTAISAPIPGSGGAGGGINSSNTGYNGGRGASMRIGLESCMPQTQTIGGNAGAAGAAGQSGGSPGVAANNFPVGLGGAGGGAGTTTTGGAGGAGGFPGGGGGGGGAGTTLSGGGGNGGAGLVQVITYL